MKTLKTILTFVMAAALFAGIVFAFSACSSTPDKPASQPPPASANVTAGTVDPLATDGGDHTVYIEAVGLTATVVSIDYSSRLVVLRGSEGGLVSCKVGPAAVNFDKVKEGDVVNIMLAQRCVTYIGRIGSKPGVEVDSTIVRVLVNGVPSAAAVNKVDFDAKVMDVDLDHRRILVKIAADDAQSFRVLPNVDLSNVHVGDSISLRITEAFAVNVERPSANTPN